MSKSRKKQALYVVERRAFRAWDFDVLHYAPSNSEEGENCVPVRAFANEAAAQACCAELTAEAKRTLPPALFGYDGVPAGLVAKIKELGLTPPKFSKDNYEQGNQLARWCAKHAAEITPEKQAAIWELFDSVELYRVSRVEMEG